MTIERSIKAIACLVMILLCCGSPGIAAKTVTAAKPAKAAAPAKSAASATKAAAVVKETNVASPSPVLSKISSYASKVRVSNDFSVTLNNVSGDGKARSSLSEGLHYLEVLGLSSNGILDNGYEYTWIAGIKMTDDKRNDIKNFSFTNLQYRMTNNIHTWTAGDVLEYYSQYSFNSALKGFSWRYEQPDNTKVQQAGVTYGIAYPRWDSFYGGTEVKSILRQAIGATVRRSIVPGLNTGFSIAQVIDDDSSRVQATDLLYKGGVYALDAQYQPFLGLDLKSELALANVKCSALGAADTNYDGTAFKVEGIGSGGPSRVTLEYERVSPKFISPLGSATSDREKVKTKWRYKYSRDILLNLGLLWYRNNLDNRAGAIGTTATRPEAGVSLRSVFNRPSANADVTYRIDLANGGGSSTQDHSLNIGYRDRFAQFDNDTLVTFASYSTETNVRKSKEITFNTNFSTQYDLGATILRPTVSLGVWNLNDDLISKTNRVTEYSLGAGVEVPEKKITGRFRIGQNNLNAQVGDSADKFFLSADAYFHPAFLERFNSGMLYVKALYNTYSYTTTVNNFRESSITSGMSIQF